MKTAIIFLLAGIAVLAFFYVKTPVTFNQSTVDIYVHDTYFIITNLIFFTAIFMSLGTLFSIGGVLGTGCRNRFFLILFIVLLLADILLIWKFYNMLYSK